MLFYCLDCLENKVMMEADGMGYLSSIVLTGVWSEDSVEAVERVCLHPPPWKKGSERCRKALDLSIPPIISLKTRTMVIVQPPTAVKGIVIRNDGCASCRSIVLHPHHSTPPTAHSLASHQPFTAPLNAGTLALLAIGDFCARRSWAWPA